MEAYIVEGEGVPDNILLSALSENDLYDNIVLRYQKDRIYTFTGEVCISMNPFRRIPGLEDTPERMSRYIGRYPYENPPHPYSVGDSAYRNMLASRRNQAILISGESGAGKTEAAKTVLRYISHATPTSKGKDMDKIKDQLLDSNPILEAFGNAKTIRNDNSSRFGKYMRVQCNQAGAPVGGVINVYLLEKSRVVTRAVDERSFHIFYNILAGATDGELSAMRLVRDHSQYQYLRLSECYSVSTINDTTDYNAVIAAMKTLEFDNTVKDAVFHVCAAVLHLGNVEFTGGDQASVKPESKSAIENAAALLSVESADLIKALTNRTVLAGGREIVTPLSPKDALYARDAYAKSLYEKCFLRIVHDINRVIENTTIKKAEQVDIGLLDIYGFEVFENNSFEQLCINYTNEKLQQVFIELTLKAEQEEYQREGIEWTPIEYFNNRVICDLIEGKPKGIIAFLDESGMLGRTTDEGFLDKLSQNFQGHKHYEDFKTTRDKAIGHGRFRLKHYAGDVIYSVEGMLDKNSDQLFRDLVRLTLSSKDAVVASLFDPSVLDTKRRPPTAGTQFRKSVQELIAMLMACDPHYIRCIKPNDKKAAQLVNEERTRHQIRYLGLVENLRVRRAGFAFRSEYNRFVQRYKIVSAQTWPNWRGGGGDRSAAEALLQEQGVTSANYRLGKTKVFLKDPMDLFKFEDLRKAALPPLIVRLDAQWRAYLVRRVYVRIRAALTIGKYARGWLAKARFQRELAAAVIQRFAKAWKAKVYFRDHKEELRKDKAVRTIQRVVVEGLLRRWFMRKVYEPFRDVTRDPKFGSDIEWPDRATPLFKPAWRYIRTMYEFWRAKQMVRALGSAGEREVRAKIKALDLFAGNKPWDPSQPLTSGPTDYVAVDTPQRGGLLNAMYPSYGVGDPEILFAFDARKINSKSKVDLRTIVITATKLIKTNSKNLKLAKYPPSPLDKLREIHLSKVADQVIVLKFEAPERDVVLDLGMPTITRPHDRVQHLVMFLQSHCKKAGWSRPKVVFQDRIDYNNARTPAKPAVPGGSVSFAPEPAGMPEVVVWPQARFTKGPAHQNTVQVTHDAVQSLAYPGTSTFRPRDLSFIGGGGGSRIGSSSRRRVASPRGTHRGKAPHRSNSGRQGGKTPRSGGSHGPTSGGSHHGGASSAANTQGAPKQPPPPSGKPKRVCQVCNSAKAKVKARMKDGQEKLMCFECKDALAGN